MKITFKILATFLCLVMFFLCFACIRPNISIAWNVSNTELTNISVSNKKITGFDLAFSLPGNFGNATSWVGIQKEEFIVEDEDYYYGDFTDQGRIATKYDFSIPSDIMENDEFKEDYGIVSFSPDDNFGFDSFGLNTNINMNISEQSISTEVDDTYYIYLWTTNDRVIYPDALIATITVDDGAIIVRDCNGENEKTYYTVEFNSNGGSDIATQVVLSGENATKPTDPTREGLEFFGWYENPGLTNEFDFESSITSNKTLYANWTSDHIVARSSAYDSTYDGNAYGIDVTVDFPLSGYTIKYGTTDGVYDLNESPTFTDVGAHIVYYEITADGYDTVTSYEVVRIQSNKYYLNNKIEGATTLYNSIKDEYPELAETLLTAIEDATAIYNNANSTEAEILNAYRDLSACCTETKIDMIGTVEYTDACLDLIIEAEISYEYGTDEETKNRVNNYNTLVAARARYNKLEVDHKAARLVEIDIDNIQIEIDYEYCMYYITRAREAYDALTSDQKALVSNYKKLQDAERIMEIAESTRLIDKNTVSFQENLSLNFLATIGDEYLDDVYVLFVYDHYGEKVEVRADVNTEDKYYYDKNDLSKFYYRFRCYLTASEMMVPVKAELYINGIDEPINYAWRDIYDYAITGLQNSNNPYEINLFKATLNYGGFTQKRFRYNNETGEHEFAYSGYYDENLDDTVEILDTNIPEMSVVSEISDEGRDTGFKNGIAYYGSSVFFRNAPYVRYYFELEEGSNINDYTFTIDGVNKTPTEKGNLYYIEGLPTKAYELDKGQNIVVKQGEKTSFDFNYSIIKWTSIVVNQTSNEDEANMARALYNYYVKAKEFVKSNQS